MALKVALVTPFSWSHPHDVNEHVAAAAAGLRALGHRVTVLAPSGRATDLLAGRRVLARAADADVIALGPSLPLSPRSSVGLPVGVRERLALALRQGAYDVVHAFEPGLPSLSYAALRDAQTLSVATFIGAERLSYPARKAQRERLVARVDALLATSEETARAAAERFRGDVAVVPEGIDVDLFHPGPKRRLGVVELAPGGFAAAHAVVRALREAEEWELVLLRARPLVARPSIPLALRSRVRVRTARDARARAALLSSASLFVPAPDGSERLHLEAAAAGAATVDPARVATQPELAAAAFLRLVDDEALRERRGTEARAQAEAAGSDRLARELDELYRRLATRRRPARRAADDPLAGRDWIVADLHMHTAASHDCSIPVAELLDHAEAEGLGAIAVTDHNVFSGAQEAVELARGRDLVVIPGEEVKTDGQGEVIGLFLETAIPRGLSFGDTIAAIREQGGLVYLPHPFDRLHAIPQSAILHRHLAEIDVLEVYNARLLFEAFNDEALRFARKYNLLMGAGSDAHVLQGVGTGALRMRRFEGPEEFLLSLRSAEVLRRPKSLAYLQSLKWVAQVKEKVR